MAQELILALLLWAFFALSLLTARRGRTNHLTLCAITGGIGLTTNISALYVPLDTALGGRNILGLIGNLFLVLNYYFLSLAIIGATRSRDERLPPRSSSGPRHLTVAPVLAALGLICSFIAVGPTTTTTAFMLDYGHLPAAAAYSMFQFGYFGYAMAFALRATVQHLPHMRTRVFRIAFTILGAGCAASLALVAVIFTMDITHVTGHLDVLRTAQAVYAPLSILAIFLLVVGLTLAPVMRALTRAVRRRRAAALHQQLTVIWDTITPDALRLPHDAIGTIRARTPLSDIEASINRRVIEIQDTLFGDPGRLNLLTAEQRATVQQAENYVSLRG